MGEIVISTPSLGQSAVEAQVLEWLVAPGEPVLAGQPVAVVESDKASIEVEAPVAGVLGAHLVAVDEVVAIGTPLTSVLVAGDGGAPPVPPSAAAPAPAAVPSAPAVPAPRHVDAGRAPVSPRARGVAETLGIDPSTVTGTGPGGLVTESDVRAAAGPGTWQGRIVRERRALSPIRRTAARRLAQSWAAAPHIVQFVDADVTATDAVRRDLGVTWTELVVTGLARCLAAFPELNAAYDDGHVVEFAEVNVGVAVDGPDGLVTPVVERADTLSAAEVATEVRRLAAAGTMSGTGTATVSNLGAFGIRAGTPVLNPPESVLVFVGAVEDRVVAFDGAPTVRRMVTLSIAYDHRVCGGMEAARFSAALRDWLQSPVL